MSLGGKDSGKLGEEIGEVFLMIYQLLISYNLVKLFESFFQNYFLIFTSRMTSFSFISFDVKHPVT